MFKISYFLLFVVIFFGTYFYVTSSLKFTDRKKLHDPRLFTNNEIGKIASLYNETYFREALRHILVPRVVGTEGHKAVRQYIVNELVGLGWDVEEDKFIAETPVFGHLEFSNVIARLNPGASRYLALSCHYDSKFMPPRFDAATDSAVPCTMMLQIARSLHPILSSIKDSDLSLKLIFFDGEEAFKEWNAYDSLYGSRNLADKWERTPFSKSGGPSNVLDSIDVLVLLDLLGSRDPKFYSFFKETQRWHSLLASIERKLKSKGHIPSNQPLHFLEKSTISTVEDDHVPFMLRGVPILHVIPLPFPHVWHTPDDNYNILHFPTIATLNKIFQVFTLAYLDGNIPNSGLPSGQIIFVILILSSLIFIAWWFKIFNSFFVRNGSSSVRTVDRNYAYKKLNQSRSRHDVVKVHS